METGKVDLIFELGETIGRYRIDSLLGVGGMGQVYRAHHLDLEEDFALKAIRREFISSETETERFRREAKTAHRLQHPHIVSIDDFNLHRGVCYLRMPYLRGIAEGDKRAVTLEDLLKIRGKPLSMDEISKYLGGMLDGLAYAHQKGVIHRDLKPSNILFSEDRVMIADFGLVRIVGEEFLQSRVRLSVFQTRVGTHGGTPGVPSTSSDAAMVGTYEYMAPEVKDGQEAGKQADIYAMGLITLFMFTGKPVIGIGMPSANYANIPAEWDYFFQRSLATDPAMRFSSADEAKAWLTSPNKAKFNQEKWQVRQQGNTSEKRPKGRRWVLGTAALLTLGLAGAGAYFHREIAEHERIAPLLERFKPSESSRDYSHLFRNPAEPVSTSGSTTEPGQMSGGTAAPSTSPQGAASLGESAGTATTAATTQQGILSYESPANTVGAAEDAAVHGASGAAMPATPATAVSAAAGTGSVPATVPSPPTSTVIVPSPSPSAATSAPVGTSVAVTRATDPAAAAQTPSTAAAGAEVQVSVADTLPDRLSLALPGSGLQMEFQYIRPGRFFYGSPADEAGRRAGEPARTEVNISRGFYLGRHEVTQEQYQSLMQRNPSRFPDGRNPVNNLAYDDMLAFAQRLTEHLRANAHERFSARLPTPEEWEYAARAGDSGAYGGYAHVEPSSGNGLREVAHFGTPTGPRRIGEMLPNRWGLFDMHGNVEECTLGGYIKGGAYRSESHELRNASVRHVGPQFRRSEFIGFRVLLEIRD